MIKKDISQENIGILREGFKQYFAEHYAELSHRDVICSDAFFIFREDIGITPEEIFELQDGLEQCREKLKVLFTARNRKNPQSDAYTYGRAIKLLKEYVCGEEELPTGKKAKAQSIRLLRSRKQHDDIKRPCVDVFFHLPFTSPSSYPFHLYNQYLFRFVTWFCEKNLEIIKAYTFCKS